MIDSHAHLHFPEFDKDREEVLKRCEDRLTAVITVGCDVEDSKKAVSLCEDRKNIYASVGVHPHSAKDFTEETLKEIEKLCLSPKVVAIGETGLDFYRNLSPKDSQFFAFESQVELAKKLNLPVIIHTRNAEKEMIEFLKGKEIKGVMHCFSGSKELLKASLDSGLYVSFSGIVTYPKNEEIRQLLRYVPSSRLLVETDAPYLSPQPKRGKRNEPIFVGFTAMEIAKVLNLTFTDIDRITTVNAKRLFGIPLTEEEKKERLVYVVRDSAYINLSPDCPCRCKFCFRGKENFILGYNLKLTRKPTAEEYMYRLKNPKIFKEVVFCGYGEPFTRFDDMIKICKWLRKMGTSRIRVDTCGLGFFLAGKDCLEKLKGLVDAFSVSLNAGNKEEYLKIVNPSVKGDPWQGVIEFVKRAKELSFEVEITAVEHPEFDRESFVRLAESLGVKWRIRPFKRFSRWEE